MVFLYTVVSLKHFNFNILFSGSLMSAWLKNKISWTIEAGTSEVNLTVQRHHLPRQILVEHFCIQTAAKQQVAVTSEQERLGFFVCLSGEDRVSLQDSKEVIHICKGVCGAYFEPKGLLNNAVYRPDEPFSVLSVTMPPEILASAFSTGNEALCRLWQEKRLPNRPYAFRCLSVQPLINSIVSQIFNPPVNQEIFPVYLEAKVLEIISLMLQLLCAQDSSTISSLSLNSQETAKLFEIRALLEEELEALPSPAQIAKQCGLGIDRMNRGFKELFGQTISQYLRDCRMEKARLLLMSGDCNVTDACFKVGYSNLSHFAKSYRRYFGHSPVKDRKKIFPIS